MYKAFFTALLLLCSGGSAVASDTAAPDKLRVVALAPHIVENRFAIGAGSNIVGTVDYADYPNEAKSIERIGGYYGISLEKLLALKPDLVIGWKSGNQSEDLEQIKQQLLRSHESGLRENHSWINTLQNAIKRSEDPTMIIHYPELIKGLSVDEVKQHCKQYLNVHHRLELQMLPKV